MPLFPGFGPLNLGSNDLTAFNVNVGQYLKATSGNLNITDNASAAALTVRTTDVQVAKPFIMASGINIQTNTTTGTIIGISTAQKVGFFGIAASTQLTVTGGRITGVALTNLLSALNTLGIIVDASTA